MSSTIKTCIEKLIPRKPDELAGVNLWPQNKILRIHFLGGEEVIKEKVKQYINLWQPHINLKLTFVDNPDAEIRIAFVMDNTSWSALGTEALDKRYFPKETMNFGWLTPETEEIKYSSVVLHEFGHALGCIHEHQNPSANIPWDVDKVYQYYLDTQGWDKAKVDQNIFRKWDSYWSQYSEFDEKSIMLYPIPKELTTNGYEVGWNTTLSDTDKEFISSMYSKS